MKMMKMTASEEHHKTDASGDNDAEQCRTCINQIMKMLKMKKILKMMKMMKMMNMNEKL